jgi:hypothetical protein
METLSIETLQHLAQMRTLSIDEAARALSLSTRSLHDKRYRLRIGLPARKIGRRTVFLEADVLKLLERGKERLPGEGRR